MSETVGEYLSQEGAAALAVALADRLEQAEQEIANLRARILSKSAVDTALGMRMERWSMSTDDALAVLRRYSNETGDELPDVAEQLITTGKLRAL